MLVRVREDERFLRDGDDLVTVLDVAGAARGARHHARGADARRRPVAVEIPAGTQPGESRPARRGLPPLCAARRGDLRVVVNVVIPRRLSREQRDLLERFADTLTDENLRSDEGVLAKLKRVLAG